MPSPLCCSGDLEVFIDYGFKVVGQREDNGWFRWLVGLAVGEPVPFLLGTEALTSVAARCR